MASQVAVIRAELLEIAELYRSGKGAPLHMMGHSIADVRWGVNSLSHTVHELHELALQANKPAK